MVASLALWVATPLLAAAQSFSDGFDTPGDRLDRSVWTTEFGDASFLGRTQLRDWVTDGGAGRFVIEGGAAKLALDTFNPTGFSLYGTHGKTRMSFQPSGTTDYVLAVRLRLTSLQPGIVYGVYFYGCVPASCAGDHDELDIEILTNYVQPGGSPLKVQLNRFSAEPLGAGHGPIVNLPAGFDPLAFHEWRIRWGVARLTYYVDDLVLFSTTSFVPQRPMSAEMDAWGPATDWTDAYSGSLQPASAASGNQTFVALVDRFSVTALLSAMPDAFPFTAQAGAGLNQVVTSNTITISGISTAAPISVAGGTFGVNGGSYGSSPGTVNNGDTVSVGVISSGSVSTTACATLTIGGASSQFCVTTQAHPPFTDDVLTPGSSVIRVVHITELRARIDAARLRVGLAPFAWTDPAPMAAITAIRAQHILDLRAALSSVYVASGLTPPTYSDPSLSVGTVIKVAHIAELRAALGSIE